MSSTVPPSTSTPRQPDLTPRDWLKRGNRCYAAGAEGAEATPLAEELRVSTGSFYHHFADFDAYQGALAQYFAQDQVADMVGAIERATADPVDRIRLLAQTVRRRGMSRLSIAMRAWAESDPRAQASVERHDDLLMAFLTGCLEQAGFARGEAGVRAYALIALGLGKVHAPHLDMATLMEQLIQIPLRAAGEMRALVVHAPSDDLSGTALAEVPDPAPGPGQVLIRVRAASLNFPDLLMTRGGYQLKPALPFTPGMEVAGEVIGGEGVVLGTRVVAGTRIGGLADLIAVDSQTVRAIPENLSFAQAASVGAAYLTAYVALVRLAALQPGEWVLVHGATGGVGLAAVDLAKALGAKVIATSRSADKLAVVRDLHAPDAVLPATGFREEAKALSGGGVDIAFDPVGGDVFDETTRTLAFGGRLLVVGFTSGRIATVATNIPLIKGFSVIGVRAGEYGRRFPDKGAENLDAVWAMAADGRIRPHVHAQVALDDWRAAFDAMERCAMVGKLVLVP